MLVPGIQGFRKRTVLIQLSTKRRRLWIWRNSVLTEFSPSVFLLVKWFFIWFFFSRIYFSKYRTASKHSEHLCCSCLLLVSPSKNVLQAEELISVLGSCLCVHVSNFPSDTACIYCLVRSVGIEVPSCWSELLEAKLCPSWQVAVCGCICAFLLRFPN